MVRVHRRGVEEAQRGLEHPSPVCIPHEVRLVDDEERIVAEYPFRLGSQVRGELLRGHHDDRRRVGQRNTERAGVPDVAGQGSEAPVEISLDLAAQAMGRNDDAHRPPATDDVRAHDVLGDQRLARARRKGQHEPSHARIQRVECPEQIQLRRPQRQDRRIAHRHRHCGSARDRRRQERPHRRGAEVVRDVPQVCGDPPGVEVGLRERRVGTLVEQLARAIEALGAVVRQVHDEVVAALDDPCGTAVRGLDEVADTDYPSQVVGLMEQGFDAIEHPSPVEREQARSHVQ